MRQKFQVGDNVKTNFNGRVTAHTITHVSVERNCQSGVTYRVDPPLHGDEHPESGWIDQGWFWRAGR
jgi:hypothetical protein